MEDFLLKAVPTHSKNLVQYVAAHFKVTPQAVHKHLARLIASGLIRKQGETRNTTYSLTALGILKINPTNRDLGRFITDQVTSLQEDRVWDRDFRAQFADFPKNIIRICDYGFTEILNNARDHSQATKVWADASLEGMVINITIRDNGIGIFRKIQSALKLDSEREAILHLSKGKFTTDPQHHTGEGIFFSSKVFDTFSISTPTLAFICDEGENWLLDKKTSIISEGTSIQMKINALSKTNLTDVFNSYTVDADVPVFEKTRVVIKLAALAEESFVSRSQAKRIVLGLEKFKEVILDFKDVSEIGPSFADEIFRVFQSKHPSILLIPVNVDPDVDAIIKRSLPVVKS